MGENKENKKSIAGQAAEDLFNFAINRDDIKTVMAHLPEGLECKPETVEYELQLLKIISTGWAISFFLLNNAQRDNLAELFWKSTYDFSRTLSETTTLMTGKNINYFEILKERLDMYVGSLSDNSDKTEPAAVIGPEFARACGNVDDIFAVMTGSRMFISTISSVKQYLEAMKL